jgi:hypothetical protein
MLKQQEKFLKRGQWIDALKYDEPVESMFQC